MEEYNHDNYRKENRDKSKELRSSPTIAEKTVWKYILGKAKTGHTFKRQRSIGPYFADFFSADLKLVIEIDGESHHHPDRYAHDRIRDKYMERVGLMVVRISNDDVQNNLEGVSKYLNGIINNRAGDLGIRGRVSVRGN